MKTAQQSTISRSECRAMTILDEDDDYTRSEIALMFGCQVPTVTRHCDGDCHHSQPASDFTRGRRIEYSDEDMLDAFRQIWDKSDYQRLSQSQYEKLRDETQPSRSAICRRFGSWTTARAEAWADTPHPHAGGGSR